MRDQLLECIESDRHEILEFTKDLIAIGTENPPGRLYLDCTNVISAKLDKLGIDHEVLEVPETVAETCGDGRCEEGPYPRYCILGSYGSGAPTLYFHGHYDVVPGASQAQFTPQVCEGRLLGRGSSDMKSGLAAMIYAVKALKSCGIKLNGGIGLTVVPDEETGGSGGSCYLGRIGRLGHEGIGMITAEPTSGVIWNACRGAISLRINITGKHAHVGLHYQGTNPFEQMVRVVNRLIELKREVSSRQTGFQIHPRAAKDSILLIGGQCRGGTGFNTVPESCSFTVDRRFNPEEDLEQEKARLFEIFDELRRDGIDIAVELLQEGDSAASGEVDPVGVALAESIADVTGGYPSFEMCPGLLETRFYARKGIPAYAYGPGLLSVVSHRQLLLLCAMHCSIVLKQSEAMLQPPSSMYRGRWHLLYFSILIG